MQHYQLPHAEDLMVMVFVLTNATCIHPHVYIHRHTSCLDMAECILKNRVLEMVSLR